MNQHSDYARRSLSAVLLVLSVLACAAPAAFAQAASSTNFKVAIVADPTGAGFTASQNRIATVGVDAALGAMSSSGFNLDLGVVAAAPFAPVTGPKVIGLASATGSCAGGEFINIFGINFIEPGATNITVRIGAAPAFAPVVVSGSELLVATPAGSGGPADVTVTTSTGTSTLIGGFTYVCPSGPPVALFTIAPGVGTTDGGTLVTMTGLSLVAGTTVAFDGVLATDVTHVNDQTLTARTPAHVSGFSTPTVSNLLGVSSLPDGFLYRTSATVLSLGGGCPGIHGLPQNFVGGALPVIGGAAFVDILANARSLSTAYFVVSDPVPGYLLPGTDCLAFVDIGSALIFAEVFTSAFGTGTMPFQLPNDPGLEGLVFNTQWGVLDAASPSGVAVSNALRVRLGY